MVEDALNKLVAEEAADGLDLDDQGMDGTDTSGKGMWQKPAAQ